MKQRADWTDHIERRFAGEAAVKTAPAGRPFKLTPYEIPETKLMDVCLSALIWHPKVAQAWRQNTGAGKFQYADKTTSQFIRFGFPGQPDLAGFMVDGKALFVEIKTSKGRLSPDQDDFLKKATANGCIAFVARSVTDITNCLRDHGYD